MWPARQDSWALVSQSCFLGDKKCTHTRGPNDAQFAHLWCTRIDFLPLQVCPVHGVDPLNLLGACSTSKALYCASAWKSEFLPFVTKHSCPCSRKQTCNNIKITAFFFRLLEAVCITLRIQILHSKHYFVTLELWKFSSFEHAVIPSKFMNRGWKYPLKI